MWCIFFQFPEDCVPNFLHFLLLYHLPYFSWADDDDDVDIDDIDDDGRIRYSIKDKFYVGFSVF